MFKQMLYRNIFMVPIICGFLVQFCKVIIYLNVDRRINIGRFFQTDGLPNLHSAVFSSLSTGIGIKYGFSSILFSLAASYSVIIIHDTMRLKGEKGKQVDVLKRFLSSIDKKGNMYGQDRLKVLSFRPFDVLAGTFLGVFGTYFLL
jgi:acid phosphatase family membrane protein YuiD